MKYYYMVYVPYVQGGVKHFIATSKKQIKDFCSANNIQIQHINDPFSEPTEGVEYEDISNSPVS
jgi:hypothetical protein